MSVDLAPPSTASSTPTVTVGEPDGAVRPAPDLEDRLRGHLATLSGGQSPWPVLQAWEDWALRLAMSPSRQIDLWSRASEAMASLWRQGSCGGDQTWAFRPEPGDRRFRDPCWGQPPFSLFAQAQLAAEAQWRAATSGASGAAALHSRRMEVLGRFALNALAPLNFAWTNPKVIEAAWRTGGLNFVIGAALLAEDFARLAGGEKLKGMEAFKVGETVAATPGQVVFRNELMELIQYAPATPQVRREPILITPAWLMKYYVLDLAAPNSMVRYLVDQGFTVFIVSWKNPGPELRDTGFEDYRRQGVAAAIDVVGRIVPGEKIHAVGYCLGGTTLAITAAAMDRDDDKRLASLTLFAAQTDFEEAGELMLFIDESELTVLEDMMHVQGYFDTRPMAAAFYALRANEMVFSKLVDRYLLGDPAGPGDMDAWLADPTRLPERVHREYLRRLVLDNSFAHGDYQADGRAVALKDIQTPTFLLGAERDHVADWRLIYRTGVQSLADTTFVLTGGGHASGVVSPPGKAGAYYRLGADVGGGGDPDAWFDATPKRDGSWWPEWVRWLDARSSAERTPPPITGRPEAGLAPLAPAPGTYVLEA